MCETSLLKYYDSGTVFSVSFIFLNLGNRSLQGIHACSMIGCVCIPMSVQTAYMGPTVFGLCSYGLQFFPWEVRLFCHHFRVRFAQLI